MMAGVTDQKAIIATVTGRVQGVGYRYAVVREAQELGLVGWVRNVTDGSVETWAQGDEPNLEQLVAFMREGPRQALVRSVDILSVNPDPSLRGFAVRF
ncbi:acylphosphatase [bacterium BMS3Bbin02]|nr:acylphosphatase [bacterium BMS3Bbin02]